MSYAPQPFSPRPDQTSSRSRPFHAAPSISWKTGITERVAALGMLESGRGTAVHADAFARISQRWERLDDVLTNFRYAAERTGTRENPEFDREFLVDHIASAAAACSTLLRGGLSSENPPVAPQFAVAYADNANWFEVVRSALMTNTPTHEELPALAEAIRQKGIETIYELAELSVAIPELDTTAVVDPYSPDWDRKTYYDPNLSAQLLRDGLRDQKFVSAPERSRELPDCVPPEIAGRNTSSGFELEW